jgi:hypothetical protein
MLMIEVYQPPLMEAIDDVPGIFLAGPIQGAPNWQKQFIKILKNEFKAPLSRRVINFIRRQKQTPSLLVFNPRFSGEMEHSPDEQVLWEKRHLERARDFGAIIFWFAAKDDSIPYEEGRTYAQTSRIELGRAFGWKDYNSSVNILIGVEPGYKGNENYFKTMTDEYNLPIYRDLGSLCQAAVELTKVK